MYGALRGDSVPETDADLAGIEAALAEAIASEPEAKRSKQNDDSSASTKAPPSAPPRRGHKRDLQTSAEALIYTLT